jgi:hypothetical protein
VIEWIDYVFNSQDCESRDLEASCPFEEELVLWQGVLLPNLPKSDPWLSTFERFSAP